MSPSAGESQRSAPEALPSNHGEVDEFLRTTIRSVVQRQLGSSKSDTASARIVSFIGGMWAAFTSHHRIITVSHLFDTASLAAKKGHELVTTTVSDLRSGDILLLLSGSSRDAIREHVAKRLAVEVIEAASLWKNALHAYVQEHPNLQSLRGKLKLVGCSKSLATIRYWVSDDYVIGPQNEVIEVPLIAQVTKNAVLTETMDKCVAAIRTVRSAHLTAGKALAEQVIQRARELAETGATLDDLVEIDDRLVLTTVDFVDHDEIEVPTNIVNSLQESTWHG